MERKVAQTELDPVEYSTLASTARKKGLTIKEALREAEVPLLDGPSEDHLAFGQPGVGLLARGRARHLDLGKVARQGLRVAGRKVPDLVFVPHEFEQLQHGRRMVPQRPRATKRLIGRRSRISLSRLVARGSLLEEDLGPLMRLRFASSAVSFALLGLAGPSLTAHAGPWSLAPGEYYSQFLASWSSSDFYYDQQGVKRPLAGGGLWEERSLVSELIPV